MQFSVADRSITLNAHEFAEFTTGPIAGGARRFDPARARLGQLWHDELRRQTTKKAPDALFEQPFTRTIVERGWKICLSGRIDQVLPRPGAPALIREVKTVTCPLPAAAETLRDDYPQHFIQLALYQRLGLDPEAHGAPPHPGELIFVEPATGVIQIIPQSPEEADALFQARLRDIWAFAELRRAGLERLR
ncbi:MAG: helicase, partial [Verrucomicrobia bacterium]